MMNNITAIWGNSGSGKTAFSVMLARSLAASKKKVILISTDSHVPMLSVLLPDERNAKSLGDALNIEKINSAVLASYVIAHKKYPNIGIMGYIGEDDPLTYPFTIYENICRLYITAAEIADYVIIDCTSRVTDYTTAAAIETAGNVVGIFTPDLRGIKCRSSQQKLLEADRKFNAVYHMVVAGQVRPYHAIKEFSEHFLNFSGILPRCESIHRADIEGKLFDCFDKCPKEYMQVIDEIKRKMNGTLN